MLSKVKWVVMGTVILCSTGSLWADDLVAPPWRGDPGSTYQQWTFSDAANPALPEISLNDYGTAVADIRPGPLNSGYWPEYPPDEPDGRQGVWDITTGTIILTIPNAPRTGPETWKEIWIQVTYYDDITDAPTVEVVGGSQTGGQTLVGGVVPGWGTYYVQQSTWYIEPNPLEETIIITGHQAWGTMVDQIVVDTICIPEPATLGLAALGALGLVLKRRRTSVA